MNDSIALAMALALEAGDTAAAGVIAAMKPADLQVILKGAASDDKASAVTDRSPARRTMAAEHYTSAIDRKQAARLLTQAEATTADTISEIVLAAVPKYQEGKPLLDKAQEEKLAETLASINSTANLLGRAKTRLNVERIVTSGQPLKMFADDAVSSLQDVIPVIRTPQEALDYFLGLIPSLGVDPQRFIGEQRRRAFTLAASTNETLTGKIRDAIAAGLKDNLKTPDITAAIEDRLREYGAVGRHPQYAEMVARTNVNDSLTTGIWEEAQGDDVADYFPVWLYMGIEDHRTGDDHRPKIGRYYPRNVTFADVRGPRPYNCRCGPSWVDYLDWRDLEAQGKRIESTW